MFEYDTKSAIQKLRAAKVANPAKPPETLATLATLAGGHVENDTPLKRLLAILDEHPCLWLYHHGGDAWSLQYEPGHELAFMSAMEVFPAAVPEIIPNQAAFVRYTNPRSIHERRGPHGSFQGAETTYFQKH